MKYSDRKIFRYISYLLLLILTVDISGSYYYFKIVEKFTKETELSNKAVMYDAGVVFFGGFKDKRQLNNESLRRLNEALNLYKSGSIRNILCAGGARPSKNLYGSELMKIKLIEYGIPIKNIIAEDISNDTVSNIRESVKIMKQYNINKTMLISSPLHIYRIHALLSDNMGSGKFLFSAYSYSRCTPPITLLTIWKQIHHEWAAWILWSVLPPSVYNMSINAIRA